MTLADLKATVARTTGKGLPTGTAFLVSSTHAITCGHCVINDAGQIVQDVDLYFSTSGREASTVVDRVDVERDVALLRLTKALNTPACRRAANGMNGAQWQAFGYPKASGKRGLTIGGDVVDNDARTGQETERPVIQLRCHEAADALHGVSGSPVFVNGAIVGMITNQAKKWGKAGPDGVREAEPAFGALFALSMAHIAAARDMAAAVEWNFVDPERHDIAGDDGASEDDLFRRYREIVESNPKLSSTKIPGSRGAFETVPLESIYIEHEVKGLTTLDDIWRRQRVAVLGEDGLGKGAFLKYLNLRLLRHGNGAAGTRLWPLHVELDRYAPHADRLDLVDFAVDDALRGGRQEPLRQRLRACNGEGRLVLFCDGLEKVHANYDMVVDALSRQPRFVAALRPGFRTDVGQEAGATLRLEPFDQRRIKAFVERWFETIAPQRIEADAASVLHQIASQPSLVELAGMPRFLALICAVIGGGQTVVPTRTALTAAAWSSVWQTAFGAESFARRQAAAKSLQTVARQVFARQGTMDREFDETDLYEALAERGEKDPDAVVARLIEQEIIVPGREASYASRSFRFLLHTFEEYLAAEQLAGDAAFLNGVSTLKIDARWTRILPVVAGILGRDGKRLPALREFLNTLGALDTGEVLGLHVCLVAECLADIDPALLPQLAPFPQKTAASLLDVWMEQSFARQRVFPWLRRLQPAEVRAGIARVLADAAAPPERRAAAAFALSAFRDRRALPELIDVADRDSSTTVRVAACLGLALLKDPDATNALIGRLRDPDLQVRMMTARCIARRRDRRLAERVLAAWLEALRRDPDDEFLRALSAVSWSLAIVSLRPEATLPLLLDALEGEGSAQAQLAAQVAGEAGVRAAVWPGIQILESDDADVQVKQSAAQMLTMLGTEAAIAALRAAFARDDHAAKFGALIGFSTIETVRYSPAAELLLDPTDASITWSVIRPIETELFEAQAAANLQALLPQVTARGREAVLAEAREEFSKPVAAAATDLFSELAKALSPNTEGIERAAAFEKIQLLGGDPELLVDALFDGNSMVALRAAAWIRARESRLPVAALLTRLDESSVSSTSLGYAAAVSALSSVSHLSTLLERQRAGSRTAAQALWVLSGQFGFRMYQDGRIELPDGQVEADPALAAERLRALDHTTTRQRSAPIDAAFLLDAARTEHRAAMETQPGDAVGWASRAAIQSAFGTSEEAYASVDKAIEGDESNPLWLRFRGLMHYDARKYEESARDLEKAVALGEHTAITYGDLGDAYNGADEFERATECFSKALDLAPDDPEARVGRAWAWHQRSEHAKAMQDLDRLLAKVPEHARGVRLRSSVQSALDGGSAGAAQRGFLQPAPPDTFDAQLLESRQHLAAGDLDSAHTAAKRVILANHLHPNARVLRARVWVEQGYPEFAVIDLKDLVARSPEPSARDAIAAALDELLEIFGTDTPRVLTDQQRADARGVRGIVLTALGVWDRGKDDLEQAVAAGATNWTILSALASLYASDLKINLERASELAQAALDALPQALLANNEDRASILHTLGLSYLGRGMLTEAQAALEQAAALVPANAKIAADLDLAKGRGV